MSFEFHNYSLIRLLSDKKEVIIEHIKALPEEDRYLRFGYPVSDDAIGTYVNNTILNADIQSNFWWGIEDEGRLVASIHVAMMNDIVEFAFTTDVEYRGKKLGQLLFARGYQFVTERQITRIYMQCLSQNAPMRHIAKKFGLSVMTHGTDVEASVEIQYPVPLSRLQEVKMCLIDMSIGS